FNNVTSRDISNKYQNLLTPVPETFTIWFLIYFTLGIFTVYQWLNKSNIDRRNLNKIRILFIINALANSGWLFSWHYEFIPLSVIIMIMILITLIIIMNIFKKVFLTSRDFLLISFPFSIYFGWITIATILNITVLLVYLNWNGFGIPEYIW